MSNSNEMDRAAGSAKQEMDALALDKETVKDLEAQTDAGEAVKGGVPRTGIQCASAACNTLLCFTPNPS